MKSRAAGAVTKRPRAMPGPGVVVIALAFVLVTAATLWRVHDMLGSRGGSAVGNGKDPATYGFDLAGFSGNRQYLVASGLPRDGIRVLDLPPCWPVSRVDSLAHAGRNKYLVSHDRVVGVTMNGASRAYPLMILNWHEVVNDTLGGVPIAVTYSPLCDAAAVYLRGTRTDAPPGESPAGSPAGSTAGSPAESAAGSPAESAPESPAESAAILLGHSGLLYNSDTLLYDRRPAHQGESLYNQITGEAMAGPARDERRALPAVSCALVYWKDWKRNRPATTVLWRDPARREMYRQEPYISYFGNDQLRFPAGPLPDDGRWPRKTPCLILDAEGSRGVLPLPLLASRANAAGEWRTTWRDRPLVFHIGEPPSTAWVEPLDAGEQGLAIRQACWFACFAMEGGRVAILP